MIKLNIILDAILSFFLLYIALINKIGPPSKTPPSSSPLTNHHLDIVTAIPITLHYIEVLPNSSVL